jgi:Gly-Xaa carboxypeptidase
MRILISGSGFQDDEAGTGNLCPEQRVLHPHTCEDAMNRGLFISPSYRCLAALRLSGAVQIPTVTYDGMAKVGIDPRWEIFYSFTKYLRDTFPIL